MADRITARELARRSQSAVHRKDREAWLGLFAPDAVVADPIGPPPLDPTGAKVTAGGNRYRPLAIQPYGTSGFKKTPDVT